jgi:hypothetical protein
MALLGRGRTAGSLRTLPTVWRWAAGAPRRPAASPGSRIVVVTRAVGLSWGVRVVDGESSDWWEGWSGGPMVRGLGGVIHSAGRGVW